MTIYGDEKKEIVYKFKRRISGIKCDICDKVIPASRWNNQKESKYFEVCTHHNQWGNDSIDSFNDYDICPDCIDKFVTDYIAKAGDTYNIEVECTFCISREEWVSE